MTDQLEEVVRFNRTARVAESFWDVSIVGHTVDDFTHNTLQIRFCEYANASIATTISVSTIDFDAAGIHRLADVLKEVAFYFEKLEPEGQG